ncbi:MAG: type II toxin-antitoxin system RelE/ParE family toxin [Alphaproteobacteria bacterium]|nr:type II toxin-antitoxin system RelE/ParE family toxin [Alphaproteobacteria bacterium]
MTNWTFRFSTEAEKQFDKLDKPIQKKIDEFFKSRVLAQPNPRTYGKQLKGRLKIFWSYRVGDYRVICNLQVKELVILALQIAHRRDVYKA